jgi:hypothetical protein
METGLFLDAEEEYLLISDRVQSNGLTNSGVRPYISGPIPGSALVPQMLEYNGYRADHIRVMSGRDVTHVLNSISRLFVIWENSPNGVTLAMKFSFFSRQILVIFLLVACVGLPSLATAQENAVVTDAVSKPLDDAARKQLNAQLELLKASGQTRLDLEQRVASSDGLATQVLEKRLDNLWSDSLVLAVDIAKTVADKRDAGFEVEDYEARVREMFLNLPAAVSDTIDRIGSRIELPDNSQSAAKQAAMDQRFFSMSAQLDGTYSALLDAITVAQRFDIDVSKEQAYLQKRISSSAANSSVFLDLALADLAGIEAGLSALPEDVELLATRAVVDKRVQGLAEVIEHHLGIMETLELPTAQYRQQLLSTTGEITAGIFNAEVIVGLLRNWGQGLLTYLIDHGPGFVFQLAIFLLIIYVTFKVATLGAEGDRYGDQGFRRTAIAIITAHDFDDFTQRGDHIWHPYRLVTTRYIVGAYACWPWYRGLCAGFCVAGLTVEFRFGHTDPAVSAL